MRKECEHTCLCDAKCYWMMANEKWMRAHKFLWCKQMRYEMKMRKECEHTCLCDAKCYWMMATENEWEHTSLCDANKWDKKWKSTHVYVMQSVIEWLQKKYGWEHTGLCDASKWNMKWKANYESNVNDGTHVYVMQRNVWYKKVQWRMIEKYTCLCDA